MHRFLARLLPVALLLLVASGCGGDDPIDTPTTPTPTQSHVFQGILEKNGAVSHPFTVTGSSSMSAQLISLSPDSTLVIGLSLGTWNGSICQVVLANDATKQGDAVLGQTQIAGDFCVRVYDAAGKVVEPQAYAVEVVYVGPAI
jgi:hypothetical protein